MKGGESRLFLCTDMAGMRLARILACTIAAALHMPSYVGVLFLKVKGDAASKDNGCLDELLKGNAIGGTGGDRLLNEERCPLKCAVCYAATQN